MLNHSDELVRWSLLAELVARSRRDEGLDRGGIGSALDAMLSIRCQRRELWSSFWVTNVSRVQLVRFTRGRAWACVRSNVFRAARAAEPARRSAAQGWALHYWLSRGDAAACSDQAARGGPPGRAAAWGPAHARARSRHAAAQPAAGPRKRLIPRPGRLQRGTRGASTATPLTTSRCALLMVNASTLLTSVGHRAFACATRTTAPSTSWGVWKPPRCAWGRELRRCTRRRVRMRGPAGAEAGGGADDGARGEPQRAGARGAALSRTSQTLHAHRFGDWRARFAVSSRCCRA